MTNYQNDMLVAIQSFDEVKEAVFTLNLDDVPCPDGITPHFYQFCWDIVFVDVYSVVVAFFKGVIFLMI